MTRFLRCVYTSETITLQPFPTRTTLSVRKSLAFEAPRAAQQGPDIPIVEEAEIPRKIEEVC
jgi:hypothetical protein